MLSMELVATAAVREPVRLLDYGPSYGRPWGSTGGAAYLPSMSDDRPRLWTPQELSTTVENEAIATGENEATQTDWVGDLGGRLGIDSAAGVKPRDVV